ncbi:MAG: heavy metal-binding domain-containing protein [Dokdonella sp.]
MDLIIGLIVFAVLMLVGWIFGGIAERRHFERLRVRENELRGVLVFNESRPSADLGLREGRVVVGSVVIAEDYFKRFAAGLKSLFGGRLTAYESLVDRGRREAILRMKQEAHTLGAKMIFNVRIETSTLTDTSNPKAIFSAEFIAYGTALFAAGK